MKMFRKTIYRVPVENSWMYIVFSSVTVNETQLSLVVWEWEYVIISGAFIQVIDWLIEVVKYESNPG